ncbi:zf-CCHC domain-containing protein [Tanacetum coccineum]
MASSANSSNQNPPRKVPRTDFIDLSSNESYPIQNIPINTTLDTTLALTIPPPRISQTIPSQGTNVSPLAPRAFVFSTPPSLPLEPHPYLTTFDDLPPRNSNPPPPSLSQGYSQCLSQTLPITTPMNFEPSFPPINLSRSRMCAQPEPLLSKEQVMQQLS